LRVTSHTGTEGNKLKGKNTMEKKMQVALPGFESTANIPQRARGRLRPLGHIRPPRKREVKLIAFKYTQIQNSCIDESLGKKDQNILSIKSSFWHDERNVTEMIFQEGDLSNDDFKKKKN